MDGRVFLIQDPGPNRDITPAMAYGRIVTIFRAEENPGLLPEEAAERLLDALVDYDPDRDHLCYAGGDWFVWNLAGYVLGLLGVRRYSYLRWERGQQSGYRPITVVDPTQQLKNSREKVHAA